MPADVHVPALSDRLDIPEGDLPGALPFDAIAPARFRPWKQGVDVSALQAASRKRVQESEAFQVMEELRERREAREDEPLSLNLEERRQQRAADEALQDKSEAAGFGTEEADPWLDEALRITRDYVQALDS